MLSHALTIVVNELERHLTDAYGMINNGPHVGLYNLAEGVEGSSNPGPVKRDTIAVSMVNIREEKTLKNIPNFERNESRLRVVYRNPPIFLNFQILFVATHVKYADALLMLSRTMRFFQSKNVFEQDNVAPNSLVTIAPVSDQLATFKLILDLYSPTMEEVNHLWGTLGGRQYPFALYTLRMLEFEFKSVQSEAGLITEVVADFQQKNAGGG